MLVCGNECAHGCLLHRGTLRGHSADHEHWKSSHFSPWLVDFYIAKPLENKDLLCRLVVLILIYLR